MKPCSGVLLWIACLLPLCARSWSSARPWFSPEMRGGYLPDRASYDSHLVRPGALGFGYRAVRPMRRPFFGDITKDIVLEPADSPAMDIHPEALIDKEGSGWVRFTFHQYRLSMHTRKNKSRRSVRLSLVQHRDNVHFRPIHTQQLVTVQDPQLLDVQSEEDGACPADRLDCVTAQEFPQLVRQTTPPPQAQRVHVPGVGVVFALGFRHQDFRQLSPYTFQLAGCVYTYTFWLKLSEVRAESGFFSLRVDNEKRRLWRWWPPLAGKPSWRRERTVWTKPFFLGTAQKLQQHQELLGASLRATNQVVDSVDFRTLLEKHMDPQFGPQSHPLITSHSSLASTQLDEFGEEELELEGLN